MDGALEPCVVTGRSQIAKDANNKASAKSMIASMIRR